MIKDTVSVRIAAGDGGDGAVKFSKGVKKFPTGGIGGKGGDVFVVGSTELYDLSGIDENKIFQAEHGEPGGINQQRGGDGKDLTIKLPVATEIYDQNGKFIYVVKEYDKPVLLRSGGVGGLGNYSFREGVDGRFDHYIMGKKGERFNVTLKFKLVSDVIFIGLPNAGKSSMLNALTNANVKVGYYPFTTLNPHLGRANKLTLMDLPGLIEGTSEGKGLGTGFVQHTDYAKLVAHFISLESEDLLKDYTTIRAELKLLDEKLYAKKEVIVLTKSDEFTKEQIAEKLKQLDSIEVPKVVCSSIDDASLKEVEKLFRENV